MKTKLSQAQQDAFEIVSAIVSEETAQKNGKLDLERYCGEWSLKLELDDYSDRQHAIDFAVSQSLEQRGESAMWKFSEAMGMTYDEANKFYMDNAD